MALTERETAQQKQVEETLIAALEKAAATLDSSVAQLREDMSAMRQEFSGIIEDMHYTSGKIDGRLDRIRHPAQAVLSQTSRPCYVSQKVYLR